MERFRKILNTAICLAMVCSFGSPAFAVYGEVQVSQEVTGPVCGNSVCETGENFINCTADCPYGAGGSGGGLAPIDAAPPIIYNLHIDKIAINSAEISWETDEQALCKLIWGKTTKYEIGSITEDVFSRNHPIDLSGLLPTTSYHFRIFCRDTAKNESETSDYYFSTLPLPDNQSPANVSELEAKAGDGQIELNWKNPPDEDFKGVRILRSERFFPLDPWNGALIYEGDDESFTDTGLSNGKRYYYTVFAFDQARNFSSGAIVYAIPRKRGVPPEEAPFEIITPEIPAAPPEEIPPKIRDLLNELTLKDFEFWQDGRQLEIVDDKVTAKPEKPLKILLKYQKVPEVLKTIVINLRRSDGKSFAFLLKINTKKTAFIATLTPPEPQEYGLKIQVMDYKNQRLKNIDGKLEIEKMSELEPPSYKRSYIYIWVYIFLPPLLLLLLLLLILVYLIRRRKGR